MNKCKVGMNCKVEFNGVDSINLTVPIIISDETVVQRYSWAEGEYYLTLDHNKDSILMDRAEILNLFVNHDTSELPIAAFQEIKVEDRKLKGVAKFDKDDEVSLKLFNKIEKGFLKTFSVGADILEKSLEKELDGVKYYRVTKWMPTEVSIAPIPAIPNAKVGLVKDLVSIPTAKSDKIVNLNKGESMELSKEKFDALMLEKSNLEAELTKATAGVEATKAELEKVSADKVELEKTLALSKQAITDKGQIVGLAFEFGMDKEATLELMKSESINEANAKTLELLKSGEATVKGDSSEEHFSKDQKDDSASIWDKIK